MAMMSTTENNETVMGERESPEVLAEQAMDCLLALLRDDRMSLACDSAAFLMQMERLWTHHNVSSRDVWHELMARMDLSEELLRRGIRARKGGRYRSTKLP